MSEKDDRRVIQAAAQDLREAVARRIAHAHGDPIVAGHLAMHRLCADAADDVIRLVLDAALKELDYAWPRLGEHPQACLLRALMPDETP